MSTQPLSNTKTDQESSGLDQVGVFITADIDQLRQLLILKQTSSVFHIPTTMVEADESTAAAAERLARQTTNLSHLPPARLITSFTQHLDNDEYWLRRRVMLRTNPNPDATLMRFILERGMRVHMIQREEDFSQVVYEEYDLQNNELALSVRRAGWVNANALTDQLTTHIYHLRITTPPQSDHVADFYWLPLTAGIKLAPEQNPWLAHARETLQQP